MSNQPPVVDFFDGVKTFNVAAGVIAKSDQKFDAKLVAFYTGMQCEELAEKLRAIFTQSGKHEDRFIENLLTHLEMLGMELKNGDHVSQVALANRVELLDADVDIQVVSEGSILAAGADGFGARLSVNNSNLAKIVDGNVIRDQASGKILKPEGWTPPNLVPFICDSDA
ncbi:hypothetical protein ADP64_000003 [Achromobacter phage phiAxp-2]|uniref:Uncharacterized protein n=1 Tax=Achromobacter phage phiAxp-2 TaxID=1664246 RepID=A0A0K2FHA9_9CAUD|nr:hypothetical protein ADP64_000003 [Achromobacter phage phiAxp-2]ALA45467.1 hypothetical protein ADP64_000003 [Achromobacter phage phiAxp-2]